MKYILSIILIYSTHFTFGQLTVSEMMKVYNMDFDQFETYAIMKGYEFQSIAKEDNFFGHVYVKGKGQNTKYIELYSKWFSYGKKVGYQTSNSTEFINFKNELKNKGFILIETEDFKGSIEKIYELNNWKLSIYTINNNDGVGYEISLKKQ
jgi:hypothetical protein